MATNSEENRPEGWRELAPGEEHSWGEMSERHWSRARAESNREAIDHMRDRSLAPGVAEGGGARNVYCMECNGVIPFGPDGGRPDHCPHCGAELERVQAMFNWVEIDDVPKGDLRSLLPLLIGLAGVAAAGIFFLWWAFQ